MPQGKGGLGPAGSRPGRGPERSTFMALAVVLDAGLPTMAVAGAVVLPAGAVAAGAAAPSAINLRLACGEAAPAPAVASSSAASASSVARGGAGIGLCFVSVCVVGCVDFKPTRVDRGKGGASRGSRCDRRARRRRVTESYHSSQRTRPAQRTTRRASESLRLAHTHRDASPRPPALSGLHLPPFLVWMGRHPGTLPPAAGCSPSPAPPPHPAQEAGARPPRPLRCPPSPNPAGAAPRPARPARARPGPHPVDLPGGDL